MRRSARADLEECGGGVCGSTDGDVGPVAAIGKSVANSEAADGGGGERPCSYVPVGAGAGDKRKHNIVVAVSGAASGVRHHAVRGKAVAGAVRGDRSEAAACDGAVEIVNKNKLGIIRGAEAANVSPVKANRKGSLVKSGRWVGGEGGRVERQHRQILISDAGKRGRDAGAASARGGIERCGVDSVGGDGGGEHSI